MRRLLLLRHAKTEGHEPGRDDRARVLIERGRGDAARIGAYMASHALTPDRVIVSTLEQIYDATPQDIVAAILDAPADAGALLIVGHNPGLHETALLLIASGNIDVRESLREQLPTSGLVVIDFAFRDWRDLHPRCGRLERFVTPKSLDPASR